MTPERGSVDHRSCPTPIPLCPLVGRDAELESLLELWRRSRLVTLFGQSGVGKSALAHAAADRLAAGTVGAVRCLDASRAPSGAALLRLLARTRPGPARSGPSGVDQRQDGGSAVHPREAVSQSPLFLLLDDVTAEARSATRGLLQW